jgi:UDP-2-acetamido-2,6-beta-L-arabino-hexul-4-ose reductase
MKILITGAKGFIGKNLIAKLNDRGYTDILPVDIDTTADVFDKYCKEAEFIYHLAGINRPKSEDEFMKGNFGFTSELLEKLKKYNNKSKILISSSIQAALDNPYGKSKKAGEDLLFSYAKEIGTEVYVYRFANVFGRWCRPNYNSVVATFCNNIARDLPIKINDRNATINLVYIDDLTDELVNALEGNPNKKDDFCYVEPVIPITLGELADTLYSFRKEGKNSKDTDIAKNLFETYKSYIPEKLKILITGAKGFLGKNLIATLNTDKNREYEIYQYDIDSNYDDLKKYTKDCDYLFNFAAVHRPKDSSEYDKVNHVFFEDILEMLKEHNNKCPVIYTSSIQAMDDTAYGHSKCDAENALKEFEKSEGNIAIIYRLTNVFGKWATPNHHSVVATFCYNIARDIPVSVSDENHEMHFYYIDDVIKSFVGLIDGTTTPDDDGIYRLSEDKIFKITLGDLAGKIKSFKESRDNIQVANMNDKITKYLYSTYLSYLPEDKFSYPLNMHSDDRGSFTEIIRTFERGQFSVNISKPGITKGNHWHHTKNEKFVVVSGEGVIKFRKIDSDKIIEYKVSGKKIEVIDIPVGYTHNITNTGDTDMVTFMWANECFDPDNPDTYYLEV